MVDWAALDVTAAVTGCASAITTCRSLMSAIPSAARRWAACQQHRSQARAAGGGASRILEADGLARALSRLCPAQFCRHAPHPAARLHARLGRRRRRSAEGRVRAMDALGDERTLSVRRARPEGAVEFRQLPRRAALDLPLRRSLGDAARDRIAVLGFQGDDAGHPHHHARRCRRVTRSAISAFSAPNTATRCGAARPNGWRQRGDGRAMRRVFSYSECQTAIALSSFRGAREREPGIHFSKCCCGAMDSGFDASHRPE